MCTKGITKEEKSSMKEKGKDKGKTSAPSTP